MEGYGLFRKDRMGRCGAGVALHVREQLNCMELLNKSQLKTTSFSSPWCSFAMCQPRNEPHSVRTSHFERAGLLYPATQAPSL